MTTDRVTAGGRLGNSVFRKPSLGLVLPGVILLQGCSHLGMRDVPSLLAPTLQRSEIFGFIAGFGTTFAALPDFLAMLKQRSSKGMNPRMAGIMCVFQVAWAYYGFLIASRPVIAWNAIAIVINGLSVGAFLYFARKERRRAQRTGT